MPAGLCARGAQSVHDRRLFSSARRGWIATYFLLEAEILPQASGSSSQGFKENTDHERCDKMARGGNTSGIKKKPERKRGERLEWG